METCAREAYAQYIDAIGREPEPMVFDFRSRLAEKPIEIMMCSNERVGYLVWHISEECLFLESIAISLKNQGRGFARAAMNYLQTQAVTASKKFIRLYTNEKMTANLSLYSHLGFHQIGRRSEDGFSRVYFEKEIDVEKEFKSI